MLPPVWRLSSSSLLLQLLCFLYLVGTANSRTARPVVVDNVRISVLTNGIVRIEHSLSRSFEDRPSLTILERFGNHVSKNLPISLGGRTPDWRSAAPVVSVTRNGNNVTTISTAYLTINVSALDPDGTLSCASINVTLLRASPQQNSLWCPEMGLTSGRNLNGSVMTTDCYASPEVCYNTYLQRMRPGLLSRDGFVVVDDTTTAVLNPADDGWVQNRPPGDDGYLDWIFVEGTDYRATFSDFVTVAGPIPLLPTTCGGASSDPTTPPA